MNISRMMSVARGVCVARERARKRERERERERKRESEKESEEERKRESERQRDRETERQREREGEKEREGGREGERDCASSLQRSLPDLSRRVCPSSAAVAPVAHVLVSRLSFPVLHRRALVLTLEWNVPTAPSAANSTTANCHASCISTRAPCLVGRHQGPFQVRAESTRAVDAVGAYLVPTLLLLQN